jgi:hypothetical protein
MYIYIKKKNVICNSLCHGYRRPGVIPNMYIYIYTYIYIYIYIYILCVYVYIYIYILCVYVYIYIYNSEVLPHGMPDAPLYIHTYNMHMYAYIDT